MKQYQSESRAGVSTAASADSQGTATPTGTGATVVLAVSAILLLSSAILSAQVRVRYTEGLVHGFLTLTTLDGSHLADGDLIQSARGTRVTSRLVFHFKDGSLQDETAIFSQRQSFRLLSDHLVQKGPAFPHPVDMTIDAVKGQVTVRHTDDDGKEKVDTEHVAQGAALVNGMILTLLKNANPQAPPTNLPFVAASPKPRLVKLAISAAGEDSFSTGGAGHKATHYVVKVELGGVTGLVAPLVGKAPPDSHVWILGGPAPAFVKSEQPFYNGGPLWRIELASPAWPRTSAASK
jgi:hypothetical protein